MPRTSCGRDWVPKGEKRTTAFLAARESLANFRVSLFVRFALFLVATSGPALAGAMERAVLQEMNLARTQPQAYATIVSSRARVLGLGAGAVAETIHFLQRQKPVGELVESAGLTQAAMSHVFDTGPRGIVGHRGSDGSHVNRRADRFGHWDQLVGENLIYGKGTPRDWVVSLIVDQGVGDRYHRVNIFRREFRFVGVASGAHATAGQMLVTDFAAKYREGGMPVVAR
jgi:uncharacterized protein YkwD